LAAIGGVAVTGALVLGYFIWDASSVKAEKAESLDADVASACSLVKKLSVKPEKAALSAYENNAAAYDGWRTEAEKIASRGDTVFEKTTPAAFKTAIVDEARRFAEKNGCIDGKIVKADFNFGFKDYITGGVLPPDNAAELKRLQREWFDVMTVLKTIASCGGNDVGITEVTMGKAKAAVEPEEPKKNAKKAKKNAKKAKKVDEQKEGAETTITSFTVAYQVRPSALVKTINALSTGERFIVVEDCTFVREKDEVAEKLGGDPKKAEATARVGSRRRRLQQQQAAAAQAEKPSAAQAVMVTDPANAPLLNVKMAVSVYDFGTLEKAQAEAAKETKQAEEAK